MNRTAHRQLAILGLALSLACVSSNAYGQKTTLTIQAAQPGKPISPDLFGVFFEDLNYAPLFGRRNHTQWHPDLIYFTGTEVFFTANYYVQQLFGRNSGDTVLATTLDSVAKPATLTASAVRDSGAGHLIVKIVNGASTPSPMAVELAGLAPGELRATRTVLTGADADAYNEDGQPAAVKPAVSEVTLKAAFDYEAPANSLTVFRIHN